MYDYTYIYNEKKSKRGINNPNAKKRAFINFQLTLNILIKFDSVIFEFS